MSRRGLPHSGIPGSKPVCGSPGLFAAYHALHRLLAPRHSPYALSSLTTSVFELTLIGCGLSALGLQLLPLRTNSISSHTACYLNAPKQDRDGIASRRKAVCQIACSKRTTVCRIFSCQRTRSTFALGATVNNRRPPSPGWACQP